MLHVRDYERGFGGRSLDGEPESRAGIVRFMFLVEIKVEVIMLLSARNRSFGCDDATT